MRNSAGPAAAASAWARTDRRRRWRALTVLALLAAVTAGFAAASLAGARRTSTAFARLRAETYAPDAIVFASQAGVYRPDWTKLRAQPEVAQLTRWYLAFGLIPGEQQETVLMGSPDGDWGTKTDKPIVKKGRMYNPHASDEMVVDEGAAQQEHISVGQTFQFHAYGAKQDDTSGDPPTGARFTLRVVGIVRTTPQFLFTPVTMLAPGVFDAHHNDMLWIDNAYVHLRPGAGGVAALQRDSNRLVASGTPVLDLHEAQRRVNTTLNVEQSALVLLALAVAAAGFVLVGQVLARSAASVGRDAQALRAVGMTRADLALAGARSHLFVAFGAGAGVIATAFVASRWFPVGLAAHVDPSRGMHADWVVLAPVALAAVVLVLAGAFLFAARASRSAHAAARRGVSGDALAAIRRGTPVSVGVGATMAFDRSARRRDVAVRPAIIGAIVGVLGVVGAYTIDHGLHDALSHPERAGVTFDATVTPVKTDYAARSLKPALFDAVASSPGVREVADIDRILIDVNGVGVPGFTVRPRPGAATAPFSLTAISGHAPRTADEIAIGPSSAKALHIRVGDTVAVGPQHRPMKVIGRALFPGDVHAAFDQGVWLDAGGWDAIVPPNTPGKQTETASGTESIIAVRFAPGVDKARAVAALNDKVGKDVEDVSAADVPIELTNLKNIERLPQVLALFLALLALAALTYLLVAMARSRAYDFAILRALGFTRRQSRAVIGAQSVAVCVVGLVVGLPLGIAAGRLAWRLITERVPLQDVAPVAALALLVIVPASLLGALLVAVWPARRVSHLRAADVLRSE